MAAASLIFSSTAIFSHKICLVKVVVVTIKVWFFWSAKDITYTLVLQFFLLKAMPTLALCMSTSVINLVIKVFMINRAYIKPAKRI